jgi:hypothetical protein
MKNPLNKFIFITFASLLVSACGGGGGPSPSTTSGGKLPLSATGFALVVEANANFSGPTTSDQAAVTASQQDTDATGLGMPPNLLTGVQSSLVSQYPGVYSLLKRLPQVLTAQDTAVLAGIASNALCNMGGPITQNSNTTSRLVLMPGDLISMPAHRCTCQEDGDTFVINGTVQTEIVSGSFGAKGPRQINTRMNLDFKQFQTAFTGADGESAVGPDGTMSI